VHIPQPDADEAPVELTPGAGGPSRFQSMWGNPRQRRRMILGGVAGTLVILLIVLHLAGRPAVSGGHPHARRFNRRAVTCRYGRVFYGCAGHVTMAAGAQPGDAGSAEWIWHGDQLHLGLLPPRDD
jgi:hypothetical protein